MRTITKLVQKLLADVYICLHLFVDSLPNSSATVEDAYMNLINGQSWDENQVVNELHSRTHFLSVSFTFLTIPTFLAEFYEFSYCSIPFRLSSSQARSRWNAFLYSFTPVKNKSQCILLYIFLPLRVKQHNTSPLKTILVYSSGEKT